MMLRLLGLWFLLIFNTVLAEETILSFHSRITIAPNGALHVVETLEVRAEGQRIQRGIYRDFPTIYQDQWGAITRVGFKVLAVKRDGMAEPFHLQPHGNGQRVYIGDRNTLLDPGIYRYQLEYTTNRQLGFFADYDELYWNVTGNGWIFPIQQASADIILPQAVDGRQVNLTGYTGASGSTQQFLTHRIQNGKRFNFKTTQPLAPNEGLTVVANWPKGIIQAPTAEELQARFVEDNQHSLLALGGLILVLIFYGGLWLKVGKDPVKGAIHPRYQAPKGFSPASTRFISQMAYDKSCFTAAIVNLVIKGEINIDQNDSGDYVISRLNPEYSDFAAGEAIILDTLFETSNEITLSRSNHRRLSKAIKQHETSLRADYEKLYFLTNKKYFFPGILISLVSLAYAFSKIPNPEIQNATIFLGIFTMIPFFVIGMTFKRYFKKRKTLAFSQIALQIVVLGTFFYIAGDTLSQLVLMFNHVAWPIVISLYLIMASNLLFQQWLKAPTRAGRKLLDEIEGFKQYLNIAEEDEINLSGQPRFTTDIYERFLPYAIALGVDHAWSQKLEQAVSAGLVDHEYKPRGFLYHNRHHSISTFSDSLSGSLDKAISTSSTAPGSSSGSSSGSSGGGGGGGGGGGW